MKPASAAGILDRLAEKSPPVLNLLASCRRPEMLHVWTEGPELPRRFARLLLKQGHPALALEVAARCLDERLCPNDPELMYCRALALARSGNPTRAVVFIQEMLARDDLAATLRIEALSLAGRIRKDLASRTSDRRVRLVRLRDACGFYRQAFEICGDSFPGINAATLALLIGERAESRAIATKVRDDVLLDLDAPGRERDCWAFATLAEACLLLGDVAAAQRHYAQAINVAREAHGDGDLAAMLRQLHLIRDNAPDSLGIDLDLLGMFRMAPVVAFAGQAIDRPGHPVRFPSDPALEAAVRRAIDKELDALEATIGYCIPGCGSEILFGEAMRQRNAELHVVLPYAEADFRVERLTYGLPELASWERRFEELRGYLRVPQHFATTEEYLGDRILHDFAGSFLQGLALTRAAQVGVETVALVVQDETEPVSPALAKFVEDWRRAGREPRIIDLRALRAGLGAPTELPTTAMPTTAAAIGASEPTVCLPRTVKAMMFADVAGFSGLPEPHLPAFFIEFLTLVERELQTTPSLFQNTWGDGLYVVFADAVTCAGFALRLLRRLERFDFAAFGFRLTEDKKPGVRIGLHVGPVYEARDAIIGKNNYFGSHVSRAARIEPVTAPGCAFVSEQFAAALAIAPEHGFVCEYLGMQPLAKEYDVCPLYRLASKMEEDSVDGRAESV